MAGSKTQIVVQQENTVNISPDGIAAIYRRECRPPNFEPDLAAYDDGYGNWTIGCGHTGPEVKEGLTWVRQQADDAFKADIGPCEATISTAVKVPLKQNEFDSLCSWAFSVGNGAAERSTLIKKLNQGKYDEVPAELRRWVYSGGKLSNGLVNRRNSEIGQWTRGAFVSSASVPVDQPPSWWQRLHLQLKTLGVGTLVSGIAADKLQTAGSQFQALAANSHWFAVIGLTLIVAGIVWNMRKNAA